MVGVDEALRDSIGSLHYAIMALEAPEGASMRDTLRELIEARLSVAEMVAALEWWQAQMRDDDCDDMGKLLDGMSAKADAALAKAKGEA